MTLTFKRGDTRHAIRALLKNNQGNPVDLSEATVFFKMKHYLLEKTVEKSVYPDAEGFLNVVFQDGETDVPGKYNAEFTITYADDRVETFPNSGYIEIQIEDKVGGVS